MAKFVICVIHEITKIFVTESWNYTVKQKILARETLTAKLIILFTKTLPSKNH